MRNIFKLLGVIIPPLLYKVKQLDDDKAQTRFDPLTLTGTVLLRSIPYNAFLRGLSQYFGYKKQHVCQNTSKLTIR